MAAQNPQPVVNGSSVAAAGLASATAALVTSRFGVAGTLVGAALTTMIITGGSAILRSYLEGVTGRVRKAPGKMRDKAGRMRPRRSADPPADEPRNIPARPDLRNNFMGRMRAAFDWFFRLPPLRRRAILVGALVPAVIAFLISMGAVTGLELAIGNSLPCGVWNKCPVAADGSQITNTRLTLAGGGAKNVDTTPNQQVQDSQQPKPGQDVQPGVDPGVQPEADPSAQPATPDPATPDAGTPNSGVPDPATPDAGNPQVEPAPAQPAPAQPAPAAPPAQETPAPSE